MVYCQRSSQRRAKPEPPLSTSSAYSSQIFDIMLSIQPLATHVSTFIADLWYQAVKPPSDGIGLATSMLARLSLSLLSSTAWMTHKSPLVY